MIGDLVLDTSVVIGVLRRQPAATGCLTKAERLWLPYTALGELEYGVAKATRPERHRAALDLFLAAVSLLPVTTETARHYGCIKALLADQGCPIPENDIWIAAAAVAHGWPLAQGMLTLNESPVWNCRIAVTECTEAVSQI